MIPIRYEVDVTSDFTRFEFDSQGPRGKIRKMVQYTQYLSENLFNLGFGDLDSATNEIDDLVITDNGDREKVLATVASTLFVFTMGSTAA